MGRKVDNKPTQNERILDYMQRFGSITQFYAMRDLGVMRLASRISDMRSMGIPIEGKIEVVTNRFGEKGYIKRYSLKEGGTGGK